MKNTPENRQDPEQALYESTDPRALAEHRLQLEARCERRATDAEQELINQVLQLLPDFVRLIGGAPKEMDSGQIHFYDVTRLNPAELSLLTEEPGVKGGYRPFHRRILVFSGPRSESLLQTAGVIVHELLHSQAFSNMGVDSVSQSPQFSTRQQRIGIRIIRPDKAITYFKDLDEAVIETLTIRFLNQYGSTIPGLIEEFERRTRFIETLPDEARARARWDIARIVQTSPSKEGGLWETEVIRHAYPKERDELNRLTAELLEKNAEEFDDQEQVFQLFVQGVIKGRLLPLARLVEKTFGRGSFRRLAGKREPIAR